MKRLMSPWRLIVVGLTFFTLIIFFLQLYVTNTVNREGVEEIAQLEKEVTQYQAEIDRLELEIATYSALQRVESRAKELGFEKRDKLEYIR